jgi:hypothetical protein
MTVTNRPCFAGWTLAPTGEAYDFQGRCVVGGDTGQDSSRMCRLPYYQHSAGGAYYDIQGFCDPTKTALPGQGGIADGLGGTIGKVLLWGGLAYGAYYLWTNRTKVKGWFT